MSTPSLAMESLLVELAATSKTRLGIPETVVTSLNGLTQLTAASSTIQFITGTATGHVVRLPDATLFGASLQYEFYNLSSQGVTIQYSDGTPLISLAQDSIAYVTLKDWTTAHGVWVAIQFTIGGIISTSLTSTNVPFSTTNQTDTFVTGFEITPQSGRSAIWFSADATLEANNALGQAVIYTGGNNGVGGAAAENSRRTVQGSSSNFRTSVNTLTIYTFNGTKHCDIRINNSVVGKYFQVNARTLLIIRLGA